MRDLAHAVPHGPRREPWRKTNRRKAALRPKHVWSIRTNFNLPSEHATWPCSTWRSAASSEDARSSDYGSNMLHPVTRSTGQPCQKKTGEPVKFELMEQTREVIDNYIATAKKQPDEFLFGGRRGRDRPTKTRQYARLVGQRIAGIGLDPEFFGTRARRRPQSIPP